VQVRESARALFLEGNRLFRVPLFAQAAEKYEAALDAWKHPAFYFNLSIAQLNLGQAVEAHENLERAMKYGPGPLGEAEFQEARKQLQEIERQLGRIFVICQTKGAEVTLDGVALFTAPGSYQGWVKAMPHEIAAKKTGYLSVAKRVSIAAGEVQEIKLKLITLSEATDTSRRWPIWKPWLAVAVGGGLAVIGGGLHALSSRTFNSYDEAFVQLSCAKGQDLMMPDSMTVPGCAKEQVPPHLEARLKLARREQYSAVGSYIAGGSLLAAGVVLLYMNRPRISERETASSSAGRVTLAPAVSRDMLGVLVSVRR
jgi:hypothetical protein